MPDFWALSYIPLIFISHAKIRVFSRLCKHSGEILLPPAFFSFSAGWGVSAFLQTKRGRKGKNALSGARYLQKKRS